MKPPRPPSPPPSDQDRTASPFPNRLRRGFSWWRAFDLRDWWWRLLDLLEAHRTLRRALYGALAALVVLGTASIWAYPWWTKRNAIKVAREWLAAGRLEYASKAVQVAIETAPEQPEVWQLAAELARLNGQKSQAINYARDAANLAPDQPEFTLNWASEALRADLPEEADRALATLSATTLAESALGQRLAGELARRRLRLTEAQQHFEAARKLEGPAALNEVPLGLILLNATDALERQRGLKLLAKWTTDREWGASALRMLLRDALLKDDRPALRKWGEALLAHPGCTVGDMPNALLALAKTDATRFHEILTRLEQDHAVSPEAAAQLIAWLNEIDQSAEALRWLKTLPAAGTSRPPVAVVAAEAWRKTADWPTLLAWIEAGDWGDNLNFLRWAYGFHAARMLGDTARADEFWRTLYSHAQLNSAQGLAAGTTLFAWGRTEAAEALWWRVANHGGDLAIEALGTLARYYQVQRDADGQYRVFFQLHSLRAQDAAINNNFAFFAALTGHNVRDAEAIARANLAREPRNLIYLATCAFVLVTQNQATEALKLLAPTTAAAKKTPALAFAYGLALANTGQKAAAKTVLDALDPATLTVQEVALIKTALGN